MNVYQTLFDLVGALSRRRYRLGERAFSAMGLSHTEARLLTRLQEESGRAAQDTISRGLLVDRSNAGRALKRLEREGYVRRESSERDKRSNIVELSAKGRRAVAEIARLRKKMAQGFFGDLTSSEAELVERLLRKALATGDE